MNIGLLLISTGKYDIFIDNLINSAKRYFLINHKVTYFLFTDSEEWLKKQEPNLVVFYKKHEKFPGPTLKRYKTFLSKEEELSKMDYLFYCDIDMLFVNSVGEEILSDRVAVEHPNYIGCCGTPERRKESLAYISEQEKNKYFAGGFNGGSTKEFLKMSKILSENIKADLLNGIIAIWHDESHMNRYFLDHLPTKILSPSYCYPESWNIPYEKKILALDKNHRMLRN